MARKVANIDKDDDQLQRIENEVSRLKSKLKSDSDALRDELENKIFISVKEVMEANQGFQKEMTQSMFEFQKNLEGNTEAC